MNDIEEYIRFRIRQLRKRGPSAAGRIDELTRLLNAFLPSNSMRRRNSLHPMQTEEEFTNIRKKLRAPFETPEPAFFAPPKDLFEKEKEIPDKKMNLWGENKEVEDGKKID